MAKNPKLALNLALLSTIATANATGGYHYVSAAEGKPLVDAGLIEVNTGMLDDAGNAASKITESGSAMLASNAPSTPVASAAGSFAIIADAELPKGRKRGGGGGAPSKYPFDTLEIGQSFFVPVSADMPDPVKTMGASVSNANERFKVPTGETKSVTRVVRGEGRKAVKDADGKNVMETVMVEVKKSERKFAARPVEAGKEYGKWVAPSDGVLVSRVALD